MTNNDRMTNNEPMTPEDHWGGPVALSPNGQWISLREVVEEEPARFSFVQLSADQKSELVAERITRRPRFDVGVIGLGMISRKRAINEVKARTRLGLTLIDIERRMIARLIELAHEGKL